MAVLLATLLMVMGGLASGIAYGVSALTASTAVQFGAQWAGPVLAMILLGLVGLAWWQYEGWADADSDDEAGESEGIVHMQRMRRVAFLAEIGLMLTVAGTGSALGGIVASDIDLPFGAPSFTWSRVFLSAAFFLAVTVLAGAGLLIGRKLRLEPGE